MKKKPTDLEDDYKLTLVFKKVIYCKKKEISGHETEAMKNKYYKYSMPEKIIQETKNEF